MSHALLCCFVMSAVDGIGVQGLRKVQLLLKEMVVMSHALFCCFVMSAS